MKTFRSLGPRLFLSHLLAIATATGTFIITFRLLAPEVFGRRIQGSGSPGGPQGSTRWGHEIVATFESSVDTALLISIIAGAIAAAIVAWIVTRFLARPVEAIRSATHSLASGNYAERVAEPSIEELAELARDVNALAAALESTETNRAQLISDVTHELRTPLTSIDGYVEGAADGVFTDEEMLASVTEETRRMRKLVDDLSLLSRAQEGSLRLERRDTDLARLAEETAERLRPQFDAAGIALTVSGGPVVVSVDSVRIGQVLTNLIGNALGHAQPEGAVTVLVGADAGGAAVSITDNGDGIDPEELSHVFDRFYRGTTTGRAGTGIGLAIARSIVDAHDGEITAESDGPGTGARFTVRLP
ncbi:MAG: HAMP domain-containing sensor histidine kinase [Actinomycetota bacterium]|nr:HAMP domain-containing sensor histidine kinase [Actinomycetota bacterium]